MSEKSQLTPVEHELMTILWKIQEGTVRDVIAQLSTHRNLAYTSVSTILRILQHKKILAAKKVGRKHIYMPMLSKDAFAEQMVKRMMRDLFSDNAVNLVTYLLEHHPFSHDDINTLQSVLEKLIQKESINNTKNNE